MYRRFIYVAAVLFLALISIQAQESPGDLEQRKIEKLRATAQIDPALAGGGAPEQDCNSAIAVCQDTYTQPTAYSGFGEVQEVPINSCLGSREKNSVWYIFTVTTAGTLEFTIDPNTNSDDYDFALYDITGRNCSDIVTGAAPEVRCNYCVDAGNTGISAAGVNPSEDCCSNSPGCQFSSLLNATVGQTLVLVVSNFTSSNSGYTLTFGGTAEIFDETPSAPTEVTAPCGTNYFDLQLSEPVLCSSISSNGTEFTLTGPGGPFTISGATGINCGTATPQLTIDVTPPLINGSQYTLTVNTGTDGNTLIDNCGNETPAGTTLTFQAVAPDAEITGPRQICQGSSTTLTANSGTSYSWSNGATTQSITVSPQESTTYSVTVTNGTCTQSASATVTVEDSPIADFSFAPGTICTGVPVSFTNNSTLLTSCFLIGGECDSDADCSGFPCVDNLTLNAWNFGDGSTSGAENPTHTYTTAGDYTVQLTLTDVFGGCTNTYSVPISVIANSGSLNVPADQDICAGETVSITASGGQSYSWTSDPPGFSSTEATIVVSPTVTTTYNVTSPGCSSDLSGSVTVTVNALPTVEATAADPTVCAGSSTTLTATGASSYNWSPASGLSSTSGSTVTAGPVTTTTYTVTGTDGNGCVNTSQVTVTVDESVNPEITPDGPVDFCGSETVAVTLQAEAGFSSYEWNTGSTSATLEVDEPGTYTVTVTDATGCTGIASITVTLLPEVNANAGSDRETCAGDGVQLTASGGSGYSWSPAVSLNNPSIANPVSTPQVTTSYIVTVSQGDCADQDTVIVEVLPLPVIDASDDVTIGPGESTDLFASGGVTYQWEPEDGLDDPTSDQPEAQPEQTTLYTVTVTGANGCVNSETVTVTILEDCEAGKIFIPNAFSPNNDGLNDVFRVQISGNYDRVDLLVQDRWGNEVFRSNDLSVGWDGTMKGTAASGDTFGYLLQIYCEDQIVTRQGSVTLIR